MPERLSPDAAPAWVAARLAGRTGHPLGRRGRLRGGRQEHPGPADRRRAARGAGSSRWTTSAGPAYAAGTGSCSPPQVLEPLLAGRPARYQRWDLVTDAGLDWVEVPRGVPVVVEGVSATDDRVPVPWDVTLWLDVPADRTAAPDPRPGPRPGAAGALAHRLVAERAGVRGGPAAVDPGRRGRQR